MRLSALINPRRSNIRRPVVWVKSSISTYSGNCVEVAGLSDGDTIQVRDSKNPRGSALRFTHEEWDAFIGGVFKGEFTRKPPRQQHRVLIVISL